MKKSIWKQVASVLLAVALGLSLIFYDNIQSMFNVGVNKVLKRNGLEGYGVSSSNPLAVKVGMKVLEDGGNAADAAVKNTVLPSRATVDKPISSIAAPFVHDNAPVAFLTSVSLSSFTM